MNQLGRTFATGAAYRRFFGMPFLAVAVLAIAGFAFAACGNDDDDNGEETARTIELGYVPGWDEGVAATFLWRHILEDQGYSVNLTALEVPILFAGIAGGDVDMYLDAWLPGTHAVYMDEFGDDINQMQLWHEPAGLFLTVPSYVDAHSLEDLAGMGAEFGNRIVGIEPGAGMMGIARESVMPTYGIDDWDLVESSTAAMLSELETSINNQEAIVVTLWSPGWWYGRWDLRNLEDPENAWGDPDGLWVVTTTEFEDQYPQLTSWLNNFWLDEEPLSQLLDMIAGVDEGNIPGVIEEWLAMDDNQATVDSWIS
jgi:glycine betaine/proline transport system substrate-binding protein